MSTASGGLPLAFALFLAAACSGAPPDYGKVELLRDTWGIPHVFSDTDRGPMYGLGYATAQDRGFQMTYGLRIMQGRLAEVVGERQKGGRRETALDNDRRMRTFGWARAAARIASNLSGWPDHPLSIGAVLHAMSAVARRRLSANDLPHWPQRSPAQLLPRQHLGFVDLHKAASYAVEPWSASAQNTLSFCPEKRLEMDTIKIMKGFVTASKFRLWRRILSRALAASILSRFVGGSLILASLFARGAETDQAPARLRIGVVQMALGSTIAENRARIVAGISNAAAHDVRVAVFPEGALRGKDGDQPALVDESVEAIRQAARHARLFVLFGGSTYATRLKREANWMLVVGPDGRDVFRYDKLYDTHEAAMPGVFHIDGIPCSAMICADRWLRGVEEIPIQEGAQVSFELSCNFVSEWVAPFGWYWYVPRALRNSVWVIFANTGNKVSNMPDDRAAPRELRHGHSAIVGPDGQIAAAARDDGETIVIADLEVAQATRAGALARATHPALHWFWEAGVKLQMGQSVEALVLKPLACAETDITLAVAQVSDNLSAMEAMISLARASNADLVVFPARAIVETALQRLQRAAREHRISVVVGAEHRVHGRSYNSAFIIGPDGSVLTRYDQLSAASPFQAGDAPSAMWFHVKGVPAVVTVGQDALWTELSEMAAVAGAQIHVHLDKDPDQGEAAALCRLQVWSNLASFETFSATANVVGSAIWDDLRDADERRAEVRGLPRPDTGRTEVYSPFSANLVVRAGATPQLIIATRHIGPKNRYHPGRTSNFNPQMDAWYRLGAAIIHPDKQSAP